MPSKIEQFKGQIELAMEQRASSPEYSPRQAEILRMLKAEVIMAISRMERQFLDDQTLNRKEFKAIFAEIKEKNREILEEVGIIDFEHFEDFIGVEYLDKVELVEDGGKVEVFGHELRLILPLNVSRRKMAGYARIVKRINEYEVLRPYVNEKVELVPFGEGRLEFVVERDGKKVKYCANYENVLRVDKDFDIEARRNHISKTIEMRRMKIALLKAVRNDKNLSEVERKYTLDSFDEDFVVRSKVPKSFRPNPAYELLVPQFNKLAADCAFELDSRKRTLFDEASGAPVEEFNLTMAYDWTYLKNEVRVDQPSKITVEYVGFGSRKNPAMFDFPLKETESHEYADGRLVKFWYRSDGTMSHREAGDQIELFDGKGEKVIAVSTKKDGSDERERRMIVPDGKESIGDFTSEKSADVQMTEEGYLEKLKRVVRTQEQYFVFEELFLEGINAGSFDLLMRIRQYGKKVTGLGYQVERFYGKHGVKIETEDFGQVGTYGLASLEAVEKALYQLDVMIGIYPPGLVKGHLHEIFLSPDLGNAGNTGRTRKNIFLPDLTSVFLKLPLSDKTFHHELFHCVDSIGTLSEDNHQWGLGVYGEDYEKRYFDSSISEYSNDKLPSGRERGFPSTYAFRSIDEDQAEVAARLLVRDSLLMKAMKEEPVLLKKVQLIKRRFFEISNGRMDGQFWKDLEAGVKINRSYWRKRERGRTGGKQRTRERKGMEDIGF